MSLFNFCYRIYARINWFFYRVSTFKKNLWKWIFPEIRYDRFFWGENDQFINTSFSEVPEYTIHMEQWIRNDGVMRRYVTYSMNPVRFYEDDPFAPTKTAWLWIGNPHNNDLDVSAELEYYKVPGNIVRPELIEKVTGLQDAYYMCPRSLTILKFPEQGIVLERDDSI